jgi:uncharacterized Zn ribbon protein
MKPKNILGLVTVASAALFLSLLAVRWHVSQKESEQLVAKSQESVIDDSVSQRIRSEYGDRATLIRTLQAKGMTFESFHQQVKQEVEASMIDDLVNQRIRSEYGDRAALIRMLQAKGMTFESFRQQVKQEVEANATRP